MFRFIPSNQLARIEIDDFYTGVLSHQFNIILLGLTY